MLSIVMSTIDSVKQAAHQAARAVKRHLSSNEHLPPMSNKKVVGRACTGLYSHISRKLLAQATGRSTSMVSYVLAGRNHKLTLDFAMAIAREIGVSVEQLQADLAEQRRKWEHQGGSRTKQSNKIKTIKER